MSATAVATRFVIAKAPFLLKNGAKMPLSAHAEMLARTSRIISSNTGSFDRCRQIGIDLVECLVVPDCCHYCKKYEGKVYSISGKDKRFPALYETALQNGYNIMHPNCRHEFVPYHESYAGSPEELQKVIEKSNRFEDLDKNDKLFKIYNKEQAFRRQLVDESREFHKLKDALGDRMPYKNIGAFRRARRTKASEYKKLHYRDRDEKQFERWANVENFKNLPKTLDKLQEIKYNNIDVWERLKREKATITEINGKMWTPTFKEKAVNNYYELRDGGVEISSHGVARMIDRGVSVDSVIEQTHRSFNYTESNGKKIKFYDSTALVYNKEGTEIVSII